MYVQADLSTMSDRLTNGAPHVMPLDFFDVGAELTSIDHGLIQELLKERSS